MIGLVLGPGTRGQEHYEMILKKDWRKKLNKWALTK